MHELKLPPQVVRARVAQWLAAPPPDHLLLIDPDPELRRILLAEIRAATSFPVREASLEDIANPAALAGAVPVCRPSKTKLIREALPAGLELITLQITSANTWITPLLPHADGQLIAVVSRWPEFLAIARTLFAAAGVPAEALLFRDAGRPRWQRGLDTAGWLLCDAHAATLPELPRKPGRIVFPLLAESAREMLSRYGR